MVATAVLRRMLVRDAGRNRRQFAALTSMVLLGVAFLVALSGAMENLQMSVDRPQSDLHLADFTAAMGQAPLDSAAVVRSLWGVEAAEGRLNLEVPVEFPGTGALPVAGRLITLPSPERPAVSDLLVVEGRYPARGDEVEFAAERGFAAHHGLKVGDAVVVETSSGNMTGRVVGIAISPEYLWPARTLWEHMPAVLGTWGVLFVPYAAAAPALGLNGTINEVAVAVAPGFDPEDVAALVTYELAPYGARGAVFKEDAPSAVILRSFVSPLATLGVVLPLFFLTIVALSTYVTLTRLVFAQRREVGVMLAIGVSRRQVLVHYLGFAALIGGGGALLGIVVGHLMAEWLTDLFAQLVSLPLSYKMPRPGLWLEGVGLSVAFAFGSAALPAWRASKGSPAAAFRGEAPTRGRPAGHRTPSRAPRSSVLRRLPFRNLRRSPGRALLTVLALGLAGSVVILPLGFIDSMDAATAARDRTQNFDLKVQLDRPVPGSTLAGAADWPGVAAAVPFLMVPATFDKARASADVQLFGFAPDADAYRLFARDGTPTSATHKGLLLSSVFELKGFEAGDVLEVGEWSLEVVGFVTDFTNSAFLPLDLLQQSFGLLAAANGLFITLGGAGSADLVKSELYAGLPVLSITSTAESSKDWESMLQLFYGFIGVIVAFGLALAGAIAFNVTTIAALERSRELATMRTLGVSNRAIGRALTVENLVLLGASVAFSAALGLLLTGYFVALFASEVFVLDPVVYAQTFAVAGLLLLGAVLAAELPSLRRVWSVDLAKATKERVG